LCFRIWASAHHWCTLRLALASELWQSMSTRAEVPRGERRHVGARQACIHRCCQALHVDPLLLGRHNGGCKPSRACLECKLPVDPFTGQPSGVGDLLGKLGSLSFRDEYGACDRSATSQQLQANLPCVVCGTPRSQTPTLWPTWASKL
jgi:hypothetical protein